MGINWKHRKVIVSIVMCVLLCVTAITAMMYTAFGAGSSNIKNVNAIQVYSNDKAGSADTCSQGKHRTGRVRFFIAYRRLDWTILKWRS